MTLKRENARTQKKWLWMTLGLTAIPLLSFALLTWMYQFTVPDRATPLAKNGVLDLSEWDMRKNGLVNLDGEWAYYADRLLTPAEAEAAPQPGAMARVPNAWFGGAAPDPASGAPYATYRLKVLLNGSEGGYGLKVSNVNRAHRLYANGALVGTKGVPSANPDEYEALNVPYTTFVAPGAQLDLLLQVANDEYASKGGFEGIQLGLQEDMLLQDHIHFAVEFSGLFILLLFAGYHLCLYVFRPQDKAYLFSALYFLTMLALVVMSGDKLLLQLLPDLSYEASKKIYNVGGFGNIIVLGLFLHSLDRGLLPRRQLAAASAPLLAVIAAAIVLPEAVFSQAGNWPWTYVLLLVVYFLYRTIRNLFREDGSLDRRETALLAGMILSIVMIEVAGLLYSLSLLETDLARRIAFLSVISFMNALLALRLAHATGRTEQLTEQLLQRDKLKDEFLAQTSHELKTPLHGIQNMTTFLLEGRAGALTDRQRLELSLIQDTSTKLSSLVNDLVDVVRLKHGDFRLQDSVLDLHVAARTAYQVLEHELAGKDVRWDNLIPQGTYVQADENRVRQVLYNLIHNAIKHTRRGRIEIGAETDGIGTKVWVEDTGVGIPPENHEAIFGYFEQMDTVPDHDGYTGMGLGLYISRQLIERMGGSIRVERSAPGSGTRMVFTLPAAEPAQASDGAALEAAATAELVGRFGPASLDVVEQSRAQTVLAVDDEPANLRILRNLLGDRYNVLTALSAADAMTKLERAERIDLMILDVMMPEMSGIELCRIVRERHSAMELPILFATVKDSLHDIELCFRAGGNDFISKPFDSRTLEARVHTLLSMRESMDEAVRSELAFLQAQIKPHFLYNAISSIVSFCYTDGEKAAHLLSMLSRYLRIVFQQDQRSADVPLGLELELIRAYVEIERARFGDRLVFRLHCDPGLESELIPSLSIQPFVENAIRHGVFEKDGTGTVTLAIADGEGYMKIQVEDDGVGMADDVLYRLRAGDRPDGAGIGMSNVRRRIAAIPGASVTVDSRLEQGTSVTLYVPKRAGDAGPAGIREGGA